MRKFILLCALTACASGFSLQELESLYVREEFSKICDFGVLDWIQENDSEAALSIYGAACAHTDWINRLNVPIIKLRSSAQARTNSVIFATLLYKKKLLQAALIDGMDISMISLPKVEHVLSDIYDDYVAKNYQKDGDRYVFGTAGDHKIVWVDRSNTPEKIKIKLEKTNSIKEYY